MQQVKYIALALLIFLYIGALVGVTSYKNTEYKKDKVQKLCDTSRAVIDGKLEQECGELQESYNMEYLCDSYAINARCWVEVK